MKNRALTAAKFICATVAIWGCPIPMNYSKLVYRLHTIFNIIILISTFLLAAATAVEMYGAMKDPAYFSKLVPFGTALHIVAVKLMILMAHRWDLQVLYHEAITFIKGADEEELSVLYYYVDKCKYFYLLMSLSPYMTVTIADIVPRMMPGKQLVAGATYPFDVDVNPAYELAFAQQAFVYFQTAPSMTMNNFTTCLLWTAVARLEIISKKLTRMSTVEEFRNLIITHQKILRFLDKTSNVAKHFLYEDLFAIVTSSIFSSLMLCTDQPLAMKVQYAVISLCGITILISICWVGDNVIATNKNLEATLYESYCTNWPPVSLSAILFFGMKIVTPEYISAKPFIKILSLEFFGNVVSLIFKYFTALRATLIQ